MLAGVHAAGRCGPVGSRRGGCTESSEPSYLSLLLRSRVSSARADRHLLPAPATSKGSWFLLRGTRRPSLFQPWPRARAAALPTAPGRPEARFRAPLLGRYRRLPQHANAPCELNTPKFRSLRHRATFLSNHIAGRSIPLLRRQSRDGAERVRKWRSYHVSNEGEQHWS